MKRKIFIMGIIMIVMMSNFVGCNSTATVTTKGAMVQSKVPDNLKLISETKVDADDILYVYLDQSYHTEVYVCKNTKTNTISITTNK